MEALRIGTASRASPQAASGADGSRRLVGWFRLGLATWALGRRENDVGAAQLYQKWFISAWYRLLISKQQGPSRPVQIQRAPQAVTGLPLTPFSSSFIVSCCLAFATCLVTCPSRTLLALIRARLLCCQSILHHRIRPARGAGSGTGHFDPFSFRQLSASCVSVAATRSTSTGQRTSKLATPRGSEAHILTHAFEYLSSSRSFRVLSGVVDGADLRGFTA